MKTFVALAMLAFSNFGVSSAQAAFPVAVQTWFTPQQVTFAAENIWAAPIFCRVRFFALTASAPYGVWSDLLIGPIFAGTWGSATMTPPLVLTGDYFISVPQVSGFCGF